MDKEPGVNSSSAGGMPPLAPPPTEAGAQPYVIKDCLSCKIIGTATFSGIGLYALHMRYNTPVADKRQRIFLACFAVSAFGIATLRMLRKDTFTTKYVN